MTDSVLSATSLPPPCSPLDDCGSHFHPAPGAAAAAVGKWRLAGMQVRLCVDPDEPRLIERYLVIGRWLHIRSSMSPWEVAMRSAQLLLDAAADRALPMHWRHLCLDNVYRPLGVLAASVDSELRARQLTALRWRLATLDLGP